MRYVIELSITVFIAAYLLPSAITALYTASTTGGAGGVGAWNPAVVVIFNILLPILIIVSVALALMPSEIKSKAGL